jgi:hypothetical protein
LGTGLRASGSRICRNANKPVITASRWLIVVAAYRSSRCPVIDTTLPCGRPGRLASRQARRKSSTTSVLTSSRLIRSPASHRQNASKSNP